MDDLVRELVASGWAFCTEDTVSETPGVTSSSSGTGTVEQVRRDSSKKAA
jgi:hypothetical protein